MLSPGAGRSVDNLSALSPTSRSEFPFHSNGRSNSVFGRPRSRRGSTASSIHSVGGALDSASGGWAATVHESGQNAISTLLQPPIIRTGLQPHTSASGFGSHKPPTARDIPPVTLSNITHVDANEFAPYLSQVGALYEQLQRIKENEDEQSTDHRSGRQDEAAESGSGHLRPGGKPRVARKSSTASLSSLNSVEAPSPVRRASSGFNRRAPQGPQPLSTIPTVYFDEDFHLENPRTFDVVSERSEVITPTLSGSRNDSSSNAAAPRKALATNAILQEKLSWYMDTIEVHLINSISTASTTFFNALGSLKELHSEAAESVQRIRALRKELAALDEEVTSTGLETVQKRRRQDNLQRLNDAVLQLKLVVDGLAECEALVDSGEIDRALSNIDSLELLIVGQYDETADGQAQPAQLSDLSGVVALQGVNNDLASLRYRVGKAYEAQFSAVLLADLRRHVEAISSADVLQRWSIAASRARGGHGRSPSVFPSYLTGTEELRSGILPNMIGLHRAQHLATAAVAYREAFLKEIRNLIRRPLPSSSEDDNESMLSVSTAGGNRPRSSQEKSSILARNLRAMGPDDAEELLAKIYMSVTETMRRFTTQFKVLLDIASSITEDGVPDGLKSPPIKSPLASPRPDRYPPTQTESGFKLQEELHRTLDMTSLLTQAVDVANDKIVKVLKVRTEQATHLPVDFFLRYFTLNLYFANECEAISGRSGTPLKTVVNGHIRDFVQKNRDTEMQKLAQGMESDQWNAKDFTDRDTALLGQILEASTHDSAAWLEKSKLWIPYYELEKASEEPAADEANGASKEKARTAIIDSDKFVLPNSAVLCLEGMANFLHLISGIPSMSTDVGSSLVAYLQLFNSRCTQLILGAGATRSAGLKNITTKHLALASQALSFIATLIPHAREFVRRHAGSGAGVSSLMGEFDRVRRQLQEHQDGIHQKLVEIMSGRAGTHARGMRGIDWDAQTSKPNAYVETLAKETTTLHRVLTKNLPDTSVLMIMGPVFSSYKEQIGAALREADIRTARAKENMLRDTDHLKTKLARVDGFGDTGDFLDDIIKSKEVQGPQAETTTADVAPAGQVDGEQGGETAPPAEPSTTETT